MFGVHLRDIRQDVIADQPAGPMPNPIDNRIEFIHIAGELFISSHPPAAGGHGNRIARLDFFGDQPVQTREEYRPDRRRSSVIHHKDHRATQILVWRNAGPPPRHCSPLQPSPRRRAVRQISRRMPRGIGNHRTVCARLTETRTRGPPLSRAGVCAPAGDTTAIMSNTARARRVVARQYTRAVLRSLQS